MVHERMGRDGLVCVENVYFWPYLLPSGATIFLSFPLGSTIVNDTLSPVLIHRPPEENHATPARLEAIGKYSAIFLH